VLTLRQRWSISKKYWQLTLLALYACGFSYGENNLGAARTVISREANVPLTALAGGGALNYLLLVSPFGDDIARDGTQDNIVNSASLPGIRKYFLDSFCDEVRSPTRAPDHDSLCPRIDGLAG
jgi:hypothetical protein